jgi:hypothetical protein
MEEGPEKVMLRRITLLALLLGSVPLVVCAATTTDTVHTSPKPEGR